MQMGRDYLKPIVIMPYEYSVYLAYGKEELVRLMEHRGFEVENNLDAVDGLAFELTDTNGTALSLVYLEEGGDDDILWHECLHVIHAMMHSMTIPISHENSEVQAYHQGHLVSEVRKRIAKRLPKEPSD